jgi:alkylation response protein AidB-like acyl-CoA dehydrogenase
MLFEAVSGFARATIAPKREHMDETEAIDDEIVKQCFELGLMGIEVPETFGGSGGSFFMSMLAVQALAQVDPGVAVLVDVQNTLVDNLLLRWGSPALRETYLPRLTKNQVGCYCLTETGAGSDAFALRTRAREDGDHWVLDGQKQFISSAMEGEIFIVFANVDPDQGYKGITAFLVERSMPGFAVGKKEKKLGIRASSTCELTLQDVKVPKANVVGEVAKGYKIAIEVLNEGRIGIGAQMVGLAEGALEGALKYAREREQFGKQLREFQAIQFQLAEIATEIEAARLMVYNAARKRDAHESFVKEAAMAKLFASNVAERAASSALEVYGGYGFTKDFPAEKFYRDAKIGKLYEGTSNMQLQTIFKLIDKD